MKSICLIILLSGWFTANAQAVGVFAGRSLMPADFIAIQYFHPSNFPLQLAAQFFAEASRRNHLRYTSYGTTISLVYSSGRESLTTSSLSYRIGLGTTIQIEQEPWVLIAQKGSTKSSIGFTGEAAGDWAISSAFSLSLFVQQRWLLKHALGNHQFIAGVGFIFHLNNE